MRGDSAIKSFERCSYYIRLMLFKLGNQLGVHGVTDEILNELQEKWVNCFHIYENDNQYLRYMFIVAKNILRHHRTEEYKYHNTHLSPSDPATVVGMDITIVDGEMFVRLLNEIAVDDGKREENPLETIIKNDIVDIVVSRLPRQLHKDIFVRIVAGDPPKKIAEELGFTANHITNVRSKYIWPVVKEVMDLSDEQYEHLTASGRICY